MVINGYLTVIIMKFSYVRFPLLVTLLLTIVVNSFSTPTLKSGWPYIVENDWGYYIYTQLTLYKHQELGWIIAVASNGEICLLDLNGNPLSGWPMQYSIDDEIVIKQGPKMGDMDGDGNPEVSFRTTSPNSITRLETYSFFGERLEHLCIVDTLVPSSRAYPAPVFVDIDGDGMKELIRTFGDSLHAQLFNGYEYPGFPIAENDNAARHGRGAVVGAGDGWEHDYNVVVWTTTGQIHAQQIGETEELPGWPIDVNPYQDFSGVSMLSTDSGWTVVLYSRFTIHAWDQDGAYLTGFPVSDFGSQNSGFAVTYYLNIADINGDNQPEILYHPYHEDIHVFNLQGEECDGFPFSIYNQGLSDMPAVMYQAHSDSAFIHIGSQSRPYYIINTAYHYNTIMQEYETRVMKDPDTYVTSATHTALIPPENDTLYVVSFNDFEGYGVRVYEIPMEGDGTHIEWQMPGNNAGGNRLYCPRYFLGVDEPDEPNPPQSYKIEPAYPNPWNSTLQMNLGNFGNGGATVSVYNILGGLVHRTEYGAGNPIGKWIWNGFDLNGIKVSSGIYLVNVETSFENYVQKTVLLK